MRCLLTGSAIDPTLAVNTSTGAHLDAAKTALRQYIRAGGGSVGIHNAFGTEYNWPWYEGLLGNANYYDHGANQDGTVKIVSRNDASTNGLPKTWPFRHEWYNLEPFPTRVKFLATVDEDTLATRRTVHPGHGDSHPVACCPVLRRWALVGDNTGARWRCIHRRLGSSGTGCLYTNGREWHQVCDGLVAVGDSPRPL